MRGGAESRDKWGPREWRGLHVDAIHYPAAPARCEVAQAFMDLWSRIHRLPCPECRSHATAYARRYPPDLTSGAGYQTWGLRFHNSVNLRLGKPLMTAAQFRAVYAAEIREVASARKPSL